MLKYLSILIRISIMGIGFVFLYRWFDAKQYLPSDEFMFAALVGLGVSILACLSAVVIQINQYSFGVCLIIAAAFGLGVYAENIPVVVGSLAAMYGAVLVQFSFIVLFKESHKKKKRW